MHVPLHGGQVGRHLVGVDRQSAEQLAGAAGTKGTFDLAKIDEIAEIFWETKKG